MKKNIFNENGIFYNEKIGLFNFPPLKMGFYCHELKTENGKRKTERVTDRRKYRVFVGRSPSQLISERAVVVIVGLAVTV